MSVKSIAECSKHSAILSTFIKLPIVIKIFILSIFEWPFYTCFTVFTSVNSVGAGEMPCFCAISSGSSLFAIAPLKGVPVYKGLYIFWMLGHIEKNVYCTRMEEQSIMYLR